MYHPTHPDARSARSGRSADGNSIKPPGHDKPCPSTGIGEDIPREDWYNEHDKLGNLITFKQYKTRSCKNCYAHSNCTRSKKGRVIQRTKFAEYYEINRRNFQEKERLYKRRQAIVEHPYGILKRQWGFSYILTKKGIERARVWQLATATATAAAKQYFSAFPGLSHLDN